MILEQPECMGQTSRRVRFEVNVMDIDMITAAHIHL